jgi:hypothetical protein
MSVHIPCSVSLRPRCRHSALSSCNQWNELLMQSLSKSSVSSAQDRLRLGFCFSARRYECIPWSAPWRHDASDKRRWSAVPRTCGLGNTRKLSVGSSIARAAYRDSNPYTIRATFVCMMMAHECVSICFWLFTHRHWHRVLVYLRSVSWLQKSSEWVSPASVPVVLYMTRTVEQYIKIFPTFVRYTRKVIYCVLCCMVLLLSFAR